MSKLETLKALPNTADLRQTAQELQTVLETAQQRLDATVRQVQDLSRLPDLTAQQVIQALKPLDKVALMGKDVQKAMEAFEQLTRIQRQSLESMAKELSDSTTGAISTHVKALEKATTSLGYSVKEAKEMPQKLTDAGLFLMSQAAALQTAAQEVQPSTWKRFAGLVLAAMIGAFLAGLGQTVSNKLVPPSETQQNAEWALKVWNKANEKERESLEKIRNRPEK